MINGYWDKFKEYINSGMTENEAHEKIIEDEWHNQNDFIEV
jgi:hypothetical protein